MLFIYKKDNFKYDIFNITYYEVKKSKFRHGISSLP